MATTEHTINDAIAELLRGTRYAWRNSNVVRSESTRLLAGSPGSQPDILIAEPHTAPVVIETEVLPAITVESEALARLGEDLSGSGRTILSSIAVRLPPRFRNAQGRRLVNAIESADDLDFALYSGEGAEKSERYPQSGWLSGGINDLSLLVQSASMPPLIIEKAADDFEKGVNQAASFLNDIAKDHPAAVQKIAAELHQQDSTQTRRMAMVILVNAFIFHEYLAGGHGGLADVRTLGELEYSNSGLQIPVILEDWKKILCVDYFPIFDIASRILRAIPAFQSHELIGRLARTATGLASIGVIRSHDLTGTVFQKLISDRKFLAAFYTTPASAALLVGLAVNEDNLLNGDWSNPDALASLRIADFACGTGTLLTTAYQRISQIHEVRGGNAEAIHPQMMARALVGCDILPAAAHLTASMLAGAYPYVQYEESAIFTAPYGVQADGKVKLGSIDLLRDMALLEGSEITAKAIEATQGAEVDIWRYAPHGSFDMVIMNPPFGRDTNHEGQRASVSHPVFAAFESSNDEQKAMANAAKKLTKGTVHNGHAGVATTFMALADKKLRIDGMLALVMPLTLMSGSSWEKCRNQLREAYDDLIVISIAGVDNAPLSFSADTGMGDCLIIGKRSGRRQFRATFVILNKAPDYAILSATIAQQVRKLIQDKTLRQLEDGPSGGNEITFGQETVGYAIDAPLPVAGGWPLARIGALSLAQSAFQLANNGLLWLPTQIETDTMTLQMSTVKAIGQIGPSHRNIRREYGGPFELRSLHGDAIPAFPILWAHDADRERTMKFKADHEGIPYRPKSATDRIVVDQAIANVSATASHCHSNLDFRFNSQSTAMQFTEKKTIGGRAWVSIGLASTDHEKALVLWGNTILALLMFWWHSSKQQPGRGVVTRTSLGSLPVLNVTALDADQLQRAAQIFDDTCQLPLKPVHELDIDENRKILDRRFYSEVLGLPDSILADGGPLDILRQKLCREPSIRGSKK